MKVNLFHTSFLRAKCTSYEDIYTFLQVIKLGLRSKTRSRIFQVWIMELRKQWKGLNLEFSKYGHREFWISTKYSKYWKFNLEKKKFSSFCLVIFFWMADDLWRNHGVSKVVWIELWKISCEVHDFHLENHYAVTSKKSLG